MGVLRATYPFSSSMTISTCQKNYISTRFRLLNYIYHFNCIKIFTWLNYTFQSIYSNTNPSSEHNLPNNLFKHTTYSFVFFWSFLHLLNPSFTHINLQFIQGKKNCEKRCYLHSVQQSYESNTCKPEIKYFTSVNCQFTSVNHRFTSVICRVTCKFEMRFRSRTK